MPRIFFVEPSGIRKEVQADNGASIMRAALNNGVTGIVAECGGCLSCATCHAYIPAELCGMLPPPSLEEKVMVECAVEYRLNSRLTCQLIVTDELDGLVVELPASQF